MPTFLSSLKPAAFTPRSRSPSPSRPESLEDYNTPTLDPATPTSYKWTPPAPRPALPPSHERRPITRSIPRKAAPKVVQVDLGVWKEVDRDGMEENVGEGGWRSGLWLAKNRDAGRDAASDECWCDKLGEVEDGLWTSTCDADWEPIRLPSQDDSDDGSTTPSLSHSESSSSSTSSSLEDTSLLSFLDYVVRTSKPRRPRTSRRVAIPSSSTLHAPPHHTIPSSSKPDLYLTTDSSALPHNPLTLSPSPSSCSSSSEWAGTGSSSSHDTDSTSIHSTSYDKPNDDTFDSMSFLPPLRRMSMFRVPLDSGKTLFLEEPGAGAASTRGSIFNTCEEEDENDDDDILIISMPQSVVA